MHKLVEIIKDSDVQKNNFEVDDIGISQVIDVWNEMKSVTASIDEGNIVYSGKYNVCILAMGALIGLPPSLVEIYGSDIKKVYKANGIPIYFGFITTTFSAMIHLLLMSVIIYAIAPFAFEAKLPNQSVFYFISLIIFIMVSLSIGSILGLVMKKQAKVTMISQLVFLPSIMLSGIMFPIEFLPDVLRWIGMIFPAAWSYQLMLDYGFGFQNLWPMMIIFVVAVVAIFLVLRKIKTDET